MGILACINERRRESPGLVLLPRPSFFILVPDYLKSKSNGDCPVLCAKIHDHIRVLEQWY